MGSTGTLYERRNKYFYSNAVETVTIKTGSGLLISIVAGKDTAGSVFSVHDGVTTGGTLITQVQSDQNNAVGTFPYNVAVTGGITIDHATAAAFITVVYR